MKLNITPGPWIIDGVFLGLQTKQNYPHDLLIVADTRPDTEFDTPFTFEQAQNATAIVTAVNNTYHKGINPEAVTEMLEVAKEVREWYEKNHAELLDQRTPICFSKLLSAIQKATL